MTTADAALPVDTSADHALPTSVPATPATTPLRGGWRIIARKELGDHLRSSRLLILLLLVALAGLAAVHSASGAIRDAATGASETPSVFLYLFTLSPDRVPSFVEFVALIGPLLGIVFGFDAVNGERAQRTLPRLAAQPIHRDDVINGKFAAGIGAIALVLVDVVAVVCGYGMLRLGIAPTSADVVRLVGFLVLAVVYISMWLGFAILLSVLSRRAATAALATLAAWLVLALFMGLIAGIVADAVRPVDDATDITQVLRNARTELVVRRISPDQLYREATAVLLNPTRQSTGIVVAEPDNGALPTALSLRESLDLAWWQLTAIASIAVVLFVAAYGFFLRQEIRA
ncbi:MAG: ABC transporter permease [Acidimicrobiia bacterium]